MFQKLPVFYVNQCCRSALASMRIRLQMRIWIRTIQFGSSYTESKIGMKEKLTRSLLGKYQILFVINGFHSSFEGRKINALSTFVVKFPTTLPPGSASFMRILKVSHLVRIRFHRCVINVTGTYFSFSGRSGKVHQSCVRASASR